MKGFEIMELRQTVRAPTDNDFTKRLTISRGDSEPRSHRLAYIECTTKVLNQS